MIPRRHLLLLSLALTACSSAPSGASGPAPEPQAAEATKLVKEQNAGVGSGSAARPGSGAGSDRADQPIMITGTYLACAIEERSEDAAAIGCDWRIRGQSRKVDTQRDVRSAAWSYALPSGTIGEVEAKTQAKDAAHHVVYRVSTPTRESLTKLIASFAVVLDFVTLDGQSLTSRKELAQLAPLEPDQAPPPPEAADVFVPTPPGAPAPLQGSVGDAIKLDPAPPESTLEAVAPGPNQPPPSSPAVSPGTLAPRPSEPQPALDGQRFPNACAKSSTGEYTIKDTFFGATESGQRTIGRTISYWTNATCSGDPARVVRSSPETSPCHIKGDRAEGPEFIVVAYDEATRRVSFKIRMEDKSQPESVSFAIP